MVQSEDRAVLKLYKLLTLQTFQPGADKMLTDYILYEKKNVVYLHGTMT